MGGAIDQLNLPSLASFEMATRRISQLVEAYQGTGAGRPNWNSVKYLAPGLEPRSVVPSVLRLYAYRCLKDAVELENQKQKLGSFGGGARAGFGAEAAVALGEGGTVGTDGGGGRGKGGKKEKGATRRLTSEPLG